MDNGYKVLSNNLSAETYKVISKDVSECFICRDGELASRDPLRRFCECKSLVAHHLCLSTWINKGLGSEDRLRCSVCNAEYQLQRLSPWRSMICQWQTWLVLITATALLGLVPYVVYCMMTTFKNPPPHTMFKVAAVCFGLLTETLLIKCLSGYFLSRYRQAEQSSFIVQARSSEEGEVGLGTWRLAMAAAAVAGHGSSEVTSGHVEERKRDGIKSGCHSLLLKL